MRSAEILETVFSTGKARIIALLFGFVSMVLLTRMLGPNGKGVQVFINTNVSLFAILLSFSISTFLTNRCAKSEKEADESATFATVVVLGGLGVFTSLFVLLYDYAPTIIEHIIPEGKDRNIYLVYFFVALWMAVYGTVIQGVWRGKKRFVFINRMVVVAPVLQVAVFLAAFLVIRVWNLEYSIAQILIVSLCVTITIFLIKISLFLYRTNVTISLKKFQFRAEYLAAIKFTYGTALLNFAVKRIDFWFINYYLSITQLGYYGLASQLTNMLVTVALPVTFIISPYLTEIENPKDQAHLLAQFSRIAVIISGVVIVFAVIVSGVILPLAFGESFSESVVPFNILCIGVMLLVVRNIYSVFNIANGDFRKNMESTMLALVATIVLDFLLIPKYGVTGAAVASVVAYLCALLYLLKYATAQLNSSWIDFVVPKQGDLISIREYAVKRLRR